MTRIFPRLTWPVLAAAALFSHALCAAGAAAQPVAVRDAWVRAPAPGQEVAAAYMELVSPLNRMTLVAVASPAAAVVELHSTTVEAGVMKMRPVGTVELPAGTPVRLAPGGLHLMLIGLKRPLRPGDRVPLTLTVQRAGAASRNVFTVDAEVRAAGGAGGHHQH